MRISRKRKPRVVVVSGKLSLEEAIQKCDELIEFAGDGHVDSETMVKLREARRSAEIGKMNRVQVHLLTTVEKSIKTSMKWKLYNLKKIAGEEATCPQIRGTGLRIDGVEWKNPVKFRGEYKFRCPRAIGGESSITLDGCEVNGCSCLGKMRAEISLAQIEKMIEAEEERDGGEEREMGWGSEARVV